MGTDGFHFSGGYEAFEEGGVAPCPIRPDLIVAAAAAVLLTSHHLCE